MPCDIFISLFWWFYCFFWRYWVYGKMLCYNFGYICCCYFEV